MSWLFPAIWEADVVLGIAWVLAHQGGWDEALVVIVPVAILAVLVAISIRNADRDAGNP